MALANGQVAAIEAVPALAVHVLLVLLVELDRNVQAHQHVASATINFDGHAPGSSVRPACERVKTAGAAGELGHSGAEVRAPRYRLWDNVR